MFSFCVDPAAIEGLSWLSCYLTTGKHMAFYMSFLVVLALLALAAPMALVFGFVGALACRSRAMPVRLLGNGYITMVRGIPDIAFFLFVPVALDQAFEFLRHKTFCSEITQPVWRGDEFLVCNAAKLPLELRRNGYTRSMDLCSLCWLLPLCWSLYWQHCGERCALCLMPSFKPLLPSV